MSDCVNCGFFQKCQNKKCVLDTAKVTSTSIIGAFILFLIIWALYSKFFKKKSTTI